MIFEPTGHFWINSLNPNQLFQISHVCPPEKSHEIFVKVCIKAIKDTYYQTGQLDQERERRDMLERGDLNFLAWGTIMEGNPTEEANFRNLGYETKGVIWLLVASNWEHLYISAF